MSPFEVALTWPKKTLDVCDEISAAEAKVVLQIDCQLSRKYHSINSQQLDGLNPFKAKIASAASDTYVGLHHHDEFSIRDALGTVGDLVKLLNAQRRSFCCITNHGSVGGWIKQYNACRKARIKPIFGMEAYVSNYRGDDPELKKAHRSANHLVLIANNLEGFYNIIRIHNDAQLSGFYYTPRANREALEKWGKGIIGSSACMAGELSRLLMEDKEAEAKETWEFYNRVFDKFFVEIQIIQCEDQKEANRRLIQFARKVGAPLLLTCDSHYLDEHYDETHDVLMCLRQKKTIMDKREKDDVWSFDVKGMFYRNADEMRKVFENGWEDKDGTHTAFKDSIFTDEVFNEAMANTLAIARGTDEIKLDSSIKLPKLYENGKDVLRVKVNAGFTARGFFKHPDRDVYLQRLKYEFGVITATGWGDYFLVMERIISDAREKFGEYAVGWGRGSAAGSLVSYCLGITDIDPIKYGLLFERFIEEGRLKAGEPPDIDVDFDPKIRDWVKQHIVELFGTEKVCSIGTYATYKTRAVILDVARALGENLAEVSAVTKRIEPLKAFEDEDGEEHKIDQMDFDEICLHYSELKDYFEAHPEVRRHAEVLRNQVKNMGTHAGGVIISEMNLQDRIPVLYDKPSSESRKVISAWAESGSVTELSAVGLVKYDLLGLKNLPIISDCVRLIEQTTGVKIARADIPIDDRESIYLGSKKDLVGIFQFENPATKPIAEAVGMESLMDVAAVTSLIRPGPMDAEINGIRMPLEYARRKHGGEYEAPEFIRKTLSKTFSLMVFQEDVMRLSTALSGFTPAEANKLRKAVGKKKADLMASVRERLISGAKTRIDAGEITLKEVEDIWENIEKFAGYGFNASVDINELVWCNGRVQRVGDVKIGDKVICFDGHQFVETDVVANYDHGTLPALEVSFEGGLQVVCSILHKFETSKGKVPLWKLLFEGEVYCADQIEQLGVRVLSENIPDKTIFSSPQEGKSDSFICKSERSGNMSWMRTEVQQQSAMPKTSTDMLDGKGDFSEEQVAGCTEEHSIGARGGHEFNIRGEIEQGYKGIDGCQRNASCDSYKTRKSGTLEQNRSVPGKSVCDSDQNISTIRLVGEEKCKSETMERNTFIGVIQKFAYGANSSKEFQGRRMVVGESPVLSKKLQEENPDSMQQHCQRSGFCQSKDLGGSGRMLALRDGIRKEALSSIEDSRERCVVESRGGEKRGNASSVGVGVLEGKRKVQTEGRLVECLSTVVGQTTSRSLSSRKVLSARFVGFRRMCDLEVRHESHNYALANGIMSCNSHAVAYGAVTTAELWLKHHYPLQFITALLNNTKLGAKKLGSSNLLGNYISYARRCEMPVLGPDVNSSGEAFKIEGKSIRFSLGHVKNVAKAAKIIESFQPFTSMADFFERVKVEPKDEIEEKPESDDGEETTEEAVADKPKEEKKAKKRKPTARRPSRKVVETLIAAGAFDCFGSRNEMLAEYYKLRKEKELPEDRTLDKWQELEAECIGLCLSRPILYKQHEEQIRKESWYLVNEIDPTRKKVLVFGEVMEIKQHISQAGNSMHIVYISDGVDSMKFFVFQGGWDCFKDNFKVGTVGAIPLARFEDGDGATRFYDDRGKHVIVKKAP